MAELTVLESKLGEVLGLAMAAQAATQKVERFLDDDNEDIRKALQQMREEARQTQERCEEVASSFEGKKTAISEKGREVKQKVEKMMTTYLDGEKDPLDGFEFLEMAEAGELGHWEIVREVAADAGAPNIVELADWARQVQRKHVEQTKEATLQLAREEDPHEPA
jgi:hypothetical protein